PGDVSGPERPAATLPIMDVDLAPAIVTELRARWQERHRRHHDLTHLEEVRAGLQTLRADGLEFDARPVTLAAWFHDAVYRPFRSDNERASAELARRLLTGDPDRAEVARLVELTASHDPGPGDRNGIALSDADLAVLGADPVRYDAYAQNVRAEYRWVPGPIYRRRRRALLAAFLAREQLFASTPACDRWEASARANLARELAALG